RKEISLMPAKGKKPTSARKTPATKGPLTKQLMKKQASDNTVPFFSGPVEFKRLKDVPNPDILKNARDHIAKLILNGGEDTISSPPKMAATTRMAATKKAHFLFSIEQSMEHLPDYATLDYEHIKEIISFTKSIEDYVNDPARSQP